MMISINLSSKFINLQEKVKIFEVEEARCSNAISLPNHRLTLLFIGSKHLHEDAEVGLEGFPRLFGELYPIQEIGEIGELEDLLVIGISKVVFDFVSHQSLDWRLLGVFHAHGDTNEFQSPCGGIDLVNSDEKRSLTFPPILLILHQVLYIAHAVFTRSSC